MMDDHFSEAFAAYRTDRDRREAHVGGGNIMRLKPTMIEDSVGMDDRPLPPLESYADEMTPDTGQSATLRRAMVAAIIPSLDRASKFYSAATLADKCVPEREWLVPELVPQKTVTLFGGDGGTGKSLLALQLAIGAATGCGWLGKPVERGRVIFISAEDDDDELHRRTDDILRQSGLTYADLSGLTMRSLAGEDALLAVETQVALIKSTLFDELDARAELDAPVLIVIDTLADVFPSNENDRAKVRQFVGILRSLALKRRCAVLLLAHPSLTGLSSGSGTSGSTAWNNSVRSRLYLSRIAPDGFEQDPDKRVLATKKANYGRIGGEIAMTWKQGIFVAEGTPAGLDKMAAGAKAERVFMRLLADLTAQGRYVSASPSNAFAPTVFASHPKAEGMTARALKGAMNMLFDRGEIVIAEHGKGAKARKHIALAGGAHHAE
jgi:RecA-family ATPase